MTTTIELGATTVVVVNDVVVAVAFEQMRITDAVVDANYAVAADRIRFVYSYSYCTTILACSAVSMGIVLMLLLPMPIRYYTCRACNTVRWRSFTTLAIPEDGDVMPDVAIL